MSYDSSLVIAAEGPCASCGAKDFDHHMGTPGIHLFTANWCGHCQKMLNEHVDSGVKSRYSIFEHEVREVSEELAKGHGYDVEYFPTIYFVKAANDNSLIKMKYEERDRSIAALNEAYKKFLTS
jgi:thiol-disulfide isomerase/thioredoxin